MYFPDPSNVRTSPEVIPSNCITTHQGRAVPGTENTTRLTMTASFASADLDQTFIHQYTHVQSPHILSLPWSVSSRSSTFQQSKNLHRGL